MAAFLNFYILSTVDKLLGENGILRNIFFGERPPKSVIFQFNKEF